MQQADCDDTIPQSLLGGAGILSFRMRNWRGKGFMPERLAVQD